MKTIKQLFTAVCVAACISAGCQQVSFEDRQAPDNYYASVETFGSDTRTVLGGSRSVVWSQGDRIAIFESNFKGQAYQVLDSYINKSEGEFELVDGLHTDGAETAMAGTIAVYPFSESLSLTSGSDGNTVINGIDFPSEQKYIANSFTDEAFPMAAFNTNGGRSLSFKNLGGILKLSLTGSYAVSTITLKSNSGQALSGQATVTFDPEGIPSVTMTDEASLSVSLVCDPVVVLDPETATDFHISIPPADFDAGFTIIVTDSDKNERLNKTDKVNNVVRSSILAMPSIRLNSDYIINSGINYIDEYSINHGPGIRIGDIVWAPVNCGYHATDYKWGKLYQWGRKYGQGYQSVDDGTYNDPVRTEIVKETVSLVAGQDISNADKFYTGSTDYDWLDQ